MAELSGCIWPTFITFFSWLFIVYEPCVLTCTLSQTPKTGSLLMPKMLQSRNTTFYNQVGQKISCRLCGQNEKFLDDECGSVLYTIPDSNEAAVFLKGVYFFLAESKAVLGASALSMALGTCSDGHATGPVCPGPYQTGHSRVRVGLWKVEIQGSNTLAWQVLTSQEPNPKQPKCSRGLQGRISHRDLLQPDLQCQYYP